MRNYTVILLNHSIGGALRGEGEIKAGMLGGMLATIANIILDPILIIVLKLGVSGAAIATVLGNAIAVIYYFIYKTKSKTNCIIELSPSYAHDMKALRVILALGLPNAISNVLSGFAGTFSNQILVGYGTGTVAAMASAGKAVMVVTMIQMEICMGIQPFLAYCYGASYGRRHLCLRVCQLSGYSGRLSAVHSTPQPSYVKIMFQTFLKGIL